MKYLAQFVGRTRGAIGIFYQCEVVVEAPDTEAARLKLYDTHEHIQGLVLTEQSKDHVCRSKPGSFGVCERCGEEVTP